MTSYQFRHPLGRGIHFWHETAIRLRLSDARKGLVPGISGSCLYVATGGQNATLRTAWYQVGLPAVSRHSEPSVVLDPVSGRSLTWLKRRLRGLLGN